MLDTTQFKIASRYFTTRWGIYYHRLKKLNVWQISEKLGYKPEKPFLSHTFEAIFFTTPVCVRPGQ